MKIKDRIIRIETSNRGESLIVSEYGITGGKIYYRDIYMGEDVFEAFEKKPDSDMLLSEFIVFHKIESNWKRYELKISTSSHAKNEMESSMRLSDDIDPDGIQNKNNLYQEIYDKLSKQETLINDPLIIDVFNEAIKGDPELVKWESVFPFFS